MVISLLKLHFVIFEINSECISYKQAATKNKCVDNPVVCNIFDKEKIVISGALGATSGG